MLHKKDPVLQALLMSRNTMETEVFLTVAVHKIPSIIFMFTNVPGIMTNPCYIHLIQYMSIQYISILSYAFITHS